MTQIARALPVAVLFLLLAYASPAAILTVGGIGGDYATIQAAVAAAAHYDTVLVAPGDYSAWSGERIYILKPLTLASVGGPEFTRIVADPSISNCVTVGLLEYPGSVVISGFTVDGLDISHGISTHEGNPGLIEDCIFQRCLTGIMLGGMSRFTITECFFTESQNGVHSTAHPSVTVEVSDCVFVDNWDIPIEGATVVRDNYIEGGYAGIVCGDGGYIERNMIRSCTTGIGVGEGDSGNILRNTIVDCETGVTTNHHLTFYSFQCNIVALNTVGIYDTNFDGSYACNNVWGNTTDYHSAHPAEDNFQDTDPLFCDSAAGDYYLYDDSPCRPDGVCGQIGAYGIGCSASAVQPMTWGRLKSLYQ